ncbi:hypothetical protein COD67_14570 [Bacillus cereus]|nr:hypothetical protein COI89_05895 [Bacillus cereus]PGU65984.1 hypothetical protein COD67_14570 [Bacillus cereus]
MLEKIPVLKNSKTFRYMGTEETYNILIRLSADKAKLLLNSYSIDELVKLLLAIHPEQQSKLMAYLNKVSLYYVVLRCILGGGKWTRG